MTHEPNRSRSPAFASRASSLNAEVLITSCGVGKKASGARNRSGRFLSAWSIGGFLIVPFLRVRRSAVERVGGPASSG